MNDRRPRLVARKPAGPPPAGTTPAAESAASTDEGIQGHLTVLASADRLAAEAAGEALLRLGASVAPALIEAFDTAPVPARRRLAFLLGRIRTTAEVGLRARVLATLTRAIEDDDWKVRRNAAIALGGVADARADSESGSASGSASAPVRSSDGGADIASALLCRVAVESDARVRVSLLLAVGSVASADALPALRGLALSSAAEQEAARKAQHSIEGRSGVSSRIAADRAVPGDIAVELWTRAGVADVTLGEARNLGLDATRVTDDRVRVRSSATFASLFGVRSALFPVLAFEPRAPVSVPDQIAREFSASGVARIMQEITEPAVTYRITLEADHDGREAAGGDAGRRHAAFPRRRDWIAAFASACTFENRATAYAWDLIVRASENRVIVGARPAAVEDARFAWRLQDVPASLHPTLAAAAVRLVPSTANDIVVDPFCGAGTLLAERARVGRYRGLHGFDHHADAIAAAAANLKEVRGVSLTQADFAAAAQLAESTPVNVILTNPPYGRRVASIREARKLHAQLDDLASRALVPGGWLVAFRPPEFPAPARLRLVSRRRVDAGGLPIDIVVAQQRPDA